MTTLSDISEPKLTTGIFPAVGATGTTALEIEGPLGARYDEVLTPGALRFIADLHEHFAGLRHGVLAARLATRGNIANGRDPRFTPSTAWIREDPSWQVAGAGPGLEDRRIEITGPCDRKMTINALNSGANLWLADLEDATSPTWANVIEGQINLQDAVRRSISFTSEEGKTYTLGETTPTIVMRPRGWHLVEKHLTYVDRTGRRMPASASLVDFGLYFYANAAELISRGSGPYFYLPKLEGHIEARVWNDVFTFAEHALAIPHGTIRATVLIETTQAAFEMEEILYELRDHCAGLNAGRWDYIFSVIKNFRTRGRRFVLPDRKNLSMTVPFMRAYTELLVSTAHRRGAHAIGGMSAFIPNKADPAVTEAALVQVAADKRREAADGFDGSWVAHPGLIDVARAEFDAVLGESPNQLSRLRPEVVVTAAQLLDFGSAGVDVTEQGVRENISISVRYIVSWLGGTGAAAIDNLMEDVATAEISRSQIWQWIHNDTVMTSGRAVSLEWVTAKLESVVAGLPRTPGDHIAEAVEIFTDVALRPEFPTFLTLGAYARYLIER